MSAFKAWLSRERVAGRKCPHAFPVMDGTMHLGDGTILQMYFAN
jgi:hypothetical protein